MGGEDYGMFEENLEKEERAYAEPFRVVKVGDDEGGYSFRSDGLLLI